MSVAATASEGGAWGIAVLAAYLRSRGAAEHDLDAYLRDRVFRDVVFETAEPDPRDVAGFAAYLSRYDAGLAVERAAVDALPEPLASTPDSAPTSDPSPEGSAQ